MHALARNFCVLFSHPICGNMSLKGVCDVEKRTRLVVKAVILICVLVVLVFIVPKALYSAHVDAYVLDSLNASKKVEAEFRAKVTITDYSHLGKDLIYKHTMNGIAIKSGDTISLYSTHLPLQTTITESDSVPDTATTDEITLRIKGGDEATAKTSLTVRERGGRRYKNAYADFDITYSITPKPPFWDVVFYF